MLSTQLKIILEFKINLIKALILSLKCSHLFSTLIYLIDPNSENILCLGNIFADIIIFHYLILCCSLKMNRLTFMFLRKSIDRCDIILERCDIILSSINLTIQFSKIFNRSINICIKMIILILISKYFLFKESILILKLRQILLKVLDFPSNRFVIDFSIF